MSDFLLDAGREQLYAEPATLPWPPTQPLPTEVDLCNPDAMMRELSKSATAGAAKVIAIGPQGGKIIGYDKHHKPVYATDADLMPDKWPGGIQALLSMGNASKTVALHVSPGSADGIFVVDIKPKADAPAFAVETFVAGLVSAPPDGLKISARTLPLPSGGTRLGVRAVPTSAPQPAVQPVKAAGKGTSKVPSGYAVVDHGDLKAGVEPGKADHGWMGAMTPLGEVAGRLRQDASKYVVRNADGAEMVVSTAQLAAFDANGKMQKQASNPFYRNLPKSAVVLKPPPALSKALAAGLDEVQVGQFGTPRQMLDKLAQHGVAALVVGGTVRDAIDGAPVKDVDVVTTTSYAANKQACSAAGFWHLNDMPWQNTVKVMGGEGLDIAAMRGRTFNATMYGDTAAKHGHMAAESNDIAADVVNRDFACNALYWDHHNDVIIDATGRGVQDAKSNTLHPPIDDFDAWLEANGPRNFARVFKFVGRGYKVSPELTKLMADRFLEQMNRPNGWTQAAKALDSAGSKYHGAKKTAQKKAMASWVTKNFGHQAAVANKMIALIGAF